MIEIIVFGSLMALIVFTRLPLGLVMLYTGAFGIMMIHPRGLKASMAISEQQIMDLATNYQFSVLPLFIMMGVFVVKAGLADELFETATAWLGHLKGGLGMATIVACGGFSALSASSSASAATMAKISIPAMSKAKYDPGFSAGTVAAGGTMGILIPPSGALIIYGLLTEESIGELFIAGIVPGLLQLLFYVLVTFMVATLIPKWAPSSERSSWKVRFDTLYKVWGVLGLFSLIIGGLIFGWFTATEAGGIGAGGAFLFALLRRKLTPKIFLECIIEAAKISAMIFIVASGALVLNQFVNLSGIPGTVVEFVQSLGFSPFMVILCFIGCYLILGCLMDGFTMIFLTVPVVVPVIQAMGYDLVWWGIVTVVVVEISLITPPVGLNVFIIKAMRPDIAIVQIFKGIFPFLFADFFRLGLILLIPALALWLPTISR